MGCFGYKPYRAIYDPDTQIPDLSGKVILITGGTSGLGEASIYLLAKHKPAAIYFTGRNASNAERVIAAVKKIEPSMAVTFLACDFASLSSVASTARTFLAQSSRLDVLMCNAGILTQPASLTRDGYEVHFGTNHVAHALLIKLLMPTLQETARAHGDARVVCLTSKGINMAPAEGVAFSKLKTDCSHFGAVKGSWVRYGQSKLANLLYAEALAERYPEVLSTSVHPGVATTTLVKNLSFLTKALTYATNPSGLITPEEGAYTQVWAATAPKGEVVNGAYYVPVCKLGDRAPITKDKTLTEKLWKWTQEELKDWKV